VPADNLRLLRGDLIEEIGGGGGMALLPLRTAVDDFVSGGGAGVSDFVCPSAIDGTLPANSTKTKMKGVNFMAGQQSLNCE
jgi:hypothetical protein